MAAKETKYRSSDFCCNLTIGEEKWKTTPKFYPTKEEAEQRVAKKAYNDLFNRHRATATPDECKQIDTQLLVDRVKKILNKSRSGYLSEGVEGEFKKKYRTELPDNWIDILTSNCDEVKIEKTQLTNKTLTLLIYNKLTIPSFELSKEDADEEWLFAKIRTVNSPSSFWLHLMKDEFNLPERFTIFSSQMKQFYESSGDNSPNLPIETISKGKFAAIQHTAGWARFQVQEVIREPSKDKQPSPEPDATAAAASSAPDAAEGHKATIENGKNSGNDVEDKENTAGEVKDSNESVQNDRNDETSETNETAQDAKSQDREDDAEKDKEKSESVSSHPEKPIDGQEDAPKSNEEGAITVRGYLVDFGVRIDIPLARLKVLDDRFYELPRQAVECSLGLKPATGRIWSDEAKDHFSPLVLNKVLCIKIVDENRMIVDIVDTADGGSKNIADELISKNVAIRPAPKAASEVNSPEREKAPQEQEQEASSSKGEISSPESDNPPGDKKDQVEENENITPKSEAESEPTVQTQWE